MVQAVNNSVDMDNPLEMMQVKMDTAKLKKRLRYHCMPAIIKAIQYAEMKVGLLKKSEPNKMVVDKIIRDYMIRPVVDGGLGMRICNASKSYNMAVAMYFLPRHQSTICNKISELEVDTLDEAMRSLGLDGTY